MDRYRARFEGWDGEPLVGEATPGYMIWGADPTLVAGRIERDLPDVALLAILRDPVERLYSAFIHHIKRGRIPPDADLLERVRRFAPEEDPQQLVAGGWYGRSLEPYASAFGDRLQVHLHEDATADPAAVYQAALRHIGADAGFRPETLEEVVFSRSAPRESPHWAPDRGRRELMPDERATLLEYFTDDIPLLEETIGRDLSDWKRVSA